MRGLSVDVENIPSELTNLNNWVLWRYKDRGNGKRTKPPFQIDGKYAKTTDARTWSSFNQCLVALDQGKDAGLGIMLGSGIVGIDLDHVIQLETNTLTPLAQEIVNRFRGTYIEISPSKEGIHIFCYGKIKRSGKGRGDNNWLEVYDRDRYFTVTGNRYNEVKSVTEQQVALDWLFTEFMDGKGTPYMSTGEERGGGQPLLSSVDMPPSTELPEADGWIDEVADRDLIDRVKNHHKQGVKFTKLWNGDLSDYNEDHSSADLALCNILAYWTSKDAVQMDRIFRQSSLMRNKWDEKHYSNGQTYGEHTLEEAISKCKKTYDESLTDESLIESDNQDRKKKSQATVLIDLVASYELFHDKDMNGYIVIPNDGGRKVLGLDSTSFSLWLSGQFYHSEGKGCSRNSIDDALNTIKAKAIHDGDLQEVYLRVANLGDHIYIDLGTPDLDIVEISKEGWQIIPAPSSINFIRKNSTTPFPIPEKGGHVSELNRFVNMDDTQFKLAVGWIVGALAGKKPYPLLILQGEQGTGKSTATKILRTFVDPTSVPLRSPPKKDDDLLVSALNSYLITLDNCSGVSNEVSDTLCRLSTGGGIDKRKLYSDTDQILMEIQRPILINGIDDIATRPDLADRSIILNLKPITSADRKTEDEIKAEFNAAAPKIFGGFLDALSCGLKNEATTALTKKPRMATFAVWVTAAEESLGWEAGSFLREFSAMADEAIEIGLEGSPVANAIRKFINGKKSWSGSLDDLLRELNAVTEYPPKSFAWPTTQKSLANAIRRLQPSLRHVGIEIVNVRSKDSRKYRITQLAPSVEETPFYPNPWDDGSQHM